MDKPGRTSAVMVVEDDAPMRRHLETAIEAHSELELTGSFDNVSDAVTALSTGIPDVLVTDLGLPDGSGLEVIRCLKQKKSDALALVVTVMGDEKSVIEAIQHGASGYLLKDESIEAVAASIVSLLGGGSPISPPIARYLMTRLQNEVAPVDDDRPTLSEREFEVLSLVAKGFRYPEIAEILGISTHTVTTYIRRIYGKLEVSSRGEAVFEAVHLGLIKLED